MDNTVITYVEHIHSKRSVLHLHLLFSLLCLLYTAGVSSVKPSLHCCEAVQSRLHLTVS